MLALEQAPPQLPQCAVLVPRSTSQPFAALPSQLPQPESQLMPHRLPVQLAVPLVELHAFGHEPQCSGSAFRFASQPFDRLPSQLPNPASHTMPQTPVAQVAVPLVELHAFGHEPQCSGSAFRFTSQPFVGRPSQSSKPGLQSKPQAPAVHVRVAFGRAGQSVVQSLQ